MFVVARWAERHLNVDGPPQKTHPIAPHLSPSVSPVTQPQDVTPVRLDRYGNFKRPEGAPILKGSPPSGVPPRVRPPHPDQPWSKDAAREKIREERRRVAEAKAEQERIARAVEAAAKREASRTKRRRGGKKERHAHFVDGDEIYSQPDAKEVFWEMTVMGTHPSSLGMERFTNFWVPRLRGLLG